MSINPDILADQFKQTGSEPPPGMALKPATVTTPTGSDIGETHAIIDGDINPTPVLSLIGAVNEGQRVMVLFWPPHGAYIIGLPGTPGTQWHPVAFDAAWADYGLGSQVCQYRLDGNWVTLRGVAKRTSGAGAGVVCTLPPAYRPQASENFAVDSDPQTHSVVVVDPSGTVTWNPGPGATASAPYVSLSGIRFAPYDYT